MYDSTQPQVQPQENGSRRVIKKHLLRVKLAEKLNYKRLIFLP